MYPTPGSFVHIQSYKHDGSLHRTWCKGFVLEADEKHIVLVTDRAWVIESDGRKWLTREPAVCFFYTDKWFNVISMIRHAGIYYYVNLASPSIYDGEAIRNIDYDLDVKVFPSGDKVILDRDEFDFNKVDYGYSQPLINIVEKELQVLLNRIDKGLLPFNSEVVLSDYAIYCNLKEQAKRKARKKPFKKKEMSEE